MKVTLPPIHEDSPTQSIRDLTEDFEEIGFLLGDQESKLHAFLKEFTTLGRAIPIAIHTPLTHAAKMLLGEIDIQKTEITVARGKFTFPPTDELIMALTKAKNMHADLLRTRIGRIAAIIASPDWQSPSFAASGTPQAGRETGKIYATINDYKRDYHRDAIRYEQAFLHNHIDAVIKLPIHVHATTSGMAAFTTILNFLLMEGKVKRSVLMGKSIYFENKMAVTALFGNCVKEVDESNTTEVCRHITKHKPSVLFLDSISNTPDVVMPDVTAIIRFLLREVTEETYLVIDNTSLNVFFQPLSLIQGRNNHLRVIVFESLNKYHQYGADRVTGGILWSLGRGTEKLFEYRAHLGTNIPDASVLSLPSPNRALLTRRLLRHGRNALILASHLQSFLTTHPNCVVARIIYPGLPDHPNYPKNAGNKFHGSYMVIELKKQYQTVTVYKRFIQALIKEAAKQNVDLVAGSSFGLSTTRVYLTAVRNTFGEPFLRVSVGTEHMQGVNALKQVFTEVLRKFR